MRLILPSIHIKFSAVVFAALFLLLETSEFTVSLLAAAAAHEAGHLIAMIVSGNRPKSITVYPFGIDIASGHSLCSYRTDIFISAAGCAVNLLLSAVFFAVLPTFAQCCAVLFLLNILPVKSLDGGRIVECFLLLRMDQDRAEGILYVTSFIFIVLLWMLSIYLLLFAPFNPTLFFICVYLFALIFLKKE